MWLFSVRRWNSYRFYIFPFDVLFFALSLVSSRFFPDLSVLKTIEPARSFFYTTWINVLCQRIPSLSNYRFFFDTLESLLTEVFFTGNIYPATCIS